jgi:hypothetical protein
MRFRLVALLLLLFVLPVLGQQNSRSLVPNSPRGLDKQYKSVFKAYEKGDEKELLERFRKFAIPERWFADEFGPEEGQKLSRQYLYRFRDFETDTVQEFNRVICDYDGGCNRGQIKTRATKATELAQAPPASTPSMPLLPVQRFRIQHFSTEVGAEENTNGGYGTCTCCNPGPCYDKSWVSSFIYVDGAFRFIGRGTCSFWDPCAGNQPSPESELNKPPEPVHFNLLQKSQSRDLLAWMAKLVGKNH